MLAVFVSKSAYKGLLSDIIFYDYYRFVVYHSIHNVC